MSTLGSWAGWKLGAYLSDDPTLAVIISSIGALAGVVIGWKMANNPNR